MFDTLSQVGNKPARPGCCRQAALFVGPQIARPFVDPRGREPGEVTNQMQIGEGFERDSSLPLDNQRLVEVLPDITPLSNEGLALDSSLRWSPDSPGEYYENKSQPNCRGRADQEIREAAGPGKINPYRRRDRCKQEDVTNHDCRKQQKHE